MTAPKRKNPSLADRLIEAGVYDEFCALLFDQQWRYEDLLEKIEEEWKMSSSLGAISRFADSQRSAYTLLRADAQYRQMLADDSIPLDEVQKKLVAERLYNLAASPNISERALLKMRDQEIKLELLKQNDRRIKILEVKLQDAEKTLDDETLTQEDRIAKMRTIFGR